MTVIESSIKYKVDMHVSGVGSACPMVQVQPGRSWRVLAKVWRRPL